MKAKIAIAAATLVSAAVAGVLLDPAGGGGRRAVDGGGEGRLGERAEAGGEADFAERRFADEEVLLRAHPQPAADPRGLRGAGGAAVTHDAGGGAPSRSGASARLFRTGVTGAEPTMGIDRAGRVFTNGVVLGPGTDGLHVLRSVVVRSSDRGASWQDVSPETHQATEDPYLFIDKTTDRVFNDDFLGGNCSQLSFTDDGATTWQAPSAVCSTETDHQTLFAGPSPAGAPKPAGYPNVVYSCANSGGALASFSTATTCSKSLDGGRTFAPAGRPGFVDGQTDARGMFGIPGHCAGSTGHGTVGPDGTVYVPRGYCDQPYLAVSRDEGATWERVQVSTLGMTADEFGTIEHEAAVSVDRRGNVFYTWEANDRTMRLAVSRDGGKTFGPARSVSAPGVEEAVFPTIDVGPDGGVAIAYMGTTDSPGPPYNEFACDAKNPLGNAVDCDKSLDYSKTKWNGYLAAIPDPTAKSPRVTSASVNDPAEPLVVGRCGPVRCGAEFDFIDAHVALGTGIVAARSRSSRATVRIAHHAAALLSSAPKVGAATRATLVSAAFGV